MRTAGGRTDVTKVTVAFLSFANVPTNEKPPLIRDMNPESPEKKAGYLRTHIWGSVS